jgi:hypothetical protein
MYLHLEPNGDVTIGDADALTSFHVAGPRPSPAAIDSARSNGVDLDDDLDHAWVSPATIAALAAGAVPAGWDERFAAMCEYAASKGWVDPAGRLRAHTEWE